MMDFHCHLDLYDDPESLVTECDARGLYVLSVTTTPSAWRGSSVLVRGCARIRLALGLHPELASQRGHELGLFEELLTETPYVGEVGLDGSREHRPHQEAQVRVFSAILAACARQSGKILSIHSRGASGAVLDLIAKEPAAGVPVLHWYTGGVRDLRRAVAMGCWFSVGEPMLRSKKGREAILEIPRPRLLLETDGPFGRAADGSRLTPLDSERALRLLAELWNVPILEAHSTVRAAFRDLLLGGTDGSGLPGNDH